MSQTVLDTPIAWSPPRKPRRLFLGRLRGLRGLVVPFLLLVLWRYVAASGIYRKSQLPAPSDVVGAGQQLWQRDELVIHLTSSMERVAWGFGYGAAIAIAIGLVVGLSRLADALLAPTIGALRAIPSLAWVPLLVLWLGIGEQPKITLIAIGVFFPVYANLVSGIRHIDCKLIEAAHAYGYRGPSLAAGILLPAALPSLFAGLRSGLAQGWLFLVAAELIAASRGLGFLLIDGQNTGRADVIVLSIVILALVGKSTDALLGLLERRLLRWTDTYRR